MSLFFGGMLGAGYGYFQLTDTSPWKTYFLIIMAMFTIAQLFSCREYNKKFRELESLEEKKKDIGTT